MRKDFLLPKYLLQVEEATGAIILICLAVILKEIVPYKGFMMNGNSLDALFVLISIGFFDSCNGYRLS
jgi:hypothetical protein